MAASELRRLLYVAATRARDHLVVSCFGKPATQKGEPSANVLLGPLAAGLPRPATNRRRSIATQRACGCSLRARPRRAGTARKRETRAPSSMPARFGGSAAPRSCPRRRGPSGR